LDAAQLPAVTVGAEIEVYTVVIGTFVGHVASAAVTSVQAPSASVTGAAVEHAVMHVSSAKNVAVTEEHVTTEGSLHVHAEQVAGS
jgi:hypothetical protein